MVLRLSATTDMTHLIREHWTCGKPIFQYGDCRVRRSAKRASMSAARLYGHAYFVDIGWSRVSPPVASGHT
jgi:hypothetical protein